MDMKAWTRHLRGDMGYEITSEGGLEARRLSRGQCAYYQGARDMWAVRAACSAGIHFDFETDSPYFELELAVGVSCRGWLAVDLEIDGVVQPTLHAEGPPAHWCAGW
ncbi:MAG: hypothetical protein PF961_11250 [Planctomycetota bacterium]|jgi:hypothetical protein|nr:hypothetical protein [Planctomycetota bacterium]